PIVYQHFGGKEGLYAVIVDRAVNDLTERIMSGMVYGASRESAEASAAAFLAFIEEEEESFRILLHDGPGSGTDGSLSLVIGEIADRTEELLATQFKDLGYDRGTAPMYARMLVGATALVGEWWLEVRTPPREEVARHIVNLMWNGLKNLERQP
ncbi:MAG: AcrR family transcriptional regulator, partial [Glaciecola sp.]